MAKLHQGIMKLKKNLVTEIWEMDALLCNHGAENAELRNAKKTGKFLDAKTLL